MGNKRYKKINELRVKAMAGDKLAQKALESEVFVPHHLRQSNGIGGLIKYGSYSGHTGNPYVRKPEDAAFVTLRLNRKKELRDARSQ